MTDEKTVDGTAKMKTLVALVRVPERVARGMQFGEGSLAWWCMDALAASWEGDFGESEWAEEAKARYGCKPEDRYRFETWDAGFVEPGSDAEKNIMGLLAERATTDTVEK